MDKWWERVAAGTRRPIVAALLSVLWPGLGHLAVRRRRAIQLLIGCSLFAVGILTYVATRSSDTLLTWPVNRGWLTTVLVFAWATLALRVMVVIDAYRLSRGRVPHSPSRSKRMFAGAGLAFVLAATAGPHVLAIRYSTAQLALLTNVFAAEEGPVALPTPLAPTSSSTPNTTDVPATTSATTTSAPTTEAQTVAVAIPEPGQHRWDGAERLTVALLGGDGGFDRRGVRTDTIIILSIDMATGSAAAFNVPRNWQRMMFPAGTAAAEQWPNGYSGLANEVYNLGLRFPEAFPDVTDPAGHAIKSSLAQLSGLPIQYYVLVDMIGVVEGIDLLGGIDVQVTEWINDRIKPIVSGGPSIDIVVDPGEHHFDGLTALGYIRSRVTSSDYHRMTRQRCVIEALIDQTSPGEILANYLGLTGIIEDHITTDIPIERLDDLIILSRDLDTSNTVSVNFIPPEFKSGAAPIAQVREAVAAALLGAETSGKVTLAQTCGSADESN